MAERDSTDRARTPGEVPPLPPHGRWVGWALMLAVGIGLAINVAWVVQNFSQLRTMGPGKPAPDFELRTLQGDRIRLSSLRGRVVLIDFWAVTCPPCLKSLPHLNHVVERFADQPVTVLAVHTQGGPRYRRAARAEARHLKLRFPVLLDGPRGEASEAYTVRVLPTTVLVDRRGRIRKVWRGMTDVDTIESAIKDALSR